MRLTIMEMGTTHKITITATAILPIFCIYYELKLVQFRGFSRDLLGIPCSPFFSNSERCGIRCSGRIRFVLYSEVKKSQVEGDAAKKERMGMDLSKVSRLGTISAIFCQRKKWILTCSVPQFNSNDGYTPKNGKHYLYTSITPRKQVVMGMEMENS